MLLRACASAACPIALAILASGCGFFAPAVSVDRAGPARVYESLNTNVLNSGELSTATREVLHAHVLTESCDDDPLTALRALHEAAVREPVRSNLFALAELAYFVGEEEDDRDAYLAAAIYAWHYLFGSSADAPNPYDRRFRWACDLYNSGVQRAFTSRDGVTLALRDRDFTLPVGRIRVHVDWSAFPWTAADYPTFEPTDLYLIEGLSLRMRDSGLGVPLIGLPATEQFRKTPASALLRVSGALADMQDGIEGTLEVHSVFDAGSVRVGDAVVPLESDLSAMLARALHESPIWKFSLSGLFSGERAVDENRLIMLRPYQPGRIPVVFVHGTASNPAYWAEMFNTLLGDPDLRKNMQFWFFQYASGNPILFSASTLRQQLQATMASVDPQGEDPALRRMILIGHSQGGLVVKLMIVDGSLDWLRQATGKTAEEFGFSEEEMQLIRQAYDFRAAPFVESAVFICTPHGGSFLADKWYARMVAKSIAMPGALQGLGDRLLRTSTTLPPELAGRIPTSLDNMNPSNAMLGILRQAPVREGISCHSIVAIGDCDPDDAAALAEANDGVVQYVSAHQDGMKSELLVPASHSCQDHALTIQEVRRILREALDDD